MTPEQRSMYIANCRTCLLSAAMKDCHNCLFKIGLTERITSRPFEHAPEAMTYPEAFGVFYAAATQKAPLPCVDFSDILGERS